MELHFLPYGRVDAILIGDRSRWVFVDGGFRRDGIKAVKYMRGLGIEKLDAYIATHRHRNHVGAAPVIIREMKPGVVYTRDARMKDRTIKLASGSAEKAAVQAAHFQVVTIGYNIKVGDLQFACIGPRKLRKCTAGALAENHNSLILLLTGSDTQQRVLLTGDTSASILGQCSAIEGVSLLKNPHHNGRLPVNILRRIKPKTVVVCNGKPPAKAYSRTTHSVSANLFTAGARGDGRVTARFKDGTCHIETTK